MCVCACVCTKKKKGWQLFPITIYSETVATYESEIKRCLYKEIKNLLGHGRCP